MLAECYFEQRKWAQFEVARRAALDSMPASEVAEYIGLALDLLSVGRAQDAAAYLERASKADPLTVGPSAALQVALFVSGRAADAQTEYVRSRSLPGDHRLVDGLAVIRLMSRPDAAPGSVQALARATPGAAPTARLTQSFIDRLATPQTARSMVQLALDSPANQNEASLRVILTFADYFGEREAAIVAAQRLAAMWATRGPLHADFVFLWEPFKTTLRADPRFKAVLRAWGLVDYYHAARNWGDFCKPVGQVDFECR